MAIRVRLLQYTQDPEKIISAAAKLCYSDSGTDDILGNLTKDKTDQFLTMLMEVGHESPTEHVSFTFSVEGVSRSLLAQLTRHRIASYSVKSQRYVKEGMFEYVLPPDIEKNPRAKAVYIKSMENAQSSYNELTDILQSEHYEEFLKNGDNEKTAKSKAEKKALEDARFVLPNSCETKLIMTMNARSLMNFFAHRCCNRAQWEIRELARQMLMLVRGVAPTLFKNSGPSCLRGNCPEGKMTCGRANEMRQLYK